ncbi:asparagine synthase (glutamine-hydrolyzing) [Desulfobacterales bacterium HSG16]|nr:asparagine synthase (glutamine-hydrolyzing) [Desulfobacterales bacterium HSG16]
MCGIAGIIQGWEASSISEQLRKMTDILSHRGPDGHGIHVDGPVGLGHRRLSIIDLVAGSQPMSCQNENLWITYNGEVYNFKEIRENLEKKGHVFLTESDTEVLLHAYEAYGENCVDYFRGMFAFAIWDKKNRSLFCARDRLGKKPFYYYFDKNRLVFGSEIKSILQADGIERELDMSALKDYLTYLYVPFPKTIFKKIFKLPPAHCMTVRVSDTDSFTLDISVRPYWDLDYRPDYSMTEEKCMEELEERLVQSVKLRLVSDVPLGAFLSGGIDSSAVVAMMSNVMDTPVKTFSIGFEESDFSELEYARMVAQRYGTDHHEIIVKPESIDVINKLAWQYDEPFADPSALPTYYVSKAASEHVTVILSGDGGDETFAGYDRYSNYFKFMKADVIPAKLRSMIFKTISEKMPYGMKGQGILRHLSRQDFSRFAGMITHSQPGYFKDLFHEDVCRSSESAPEFYNEDFRFLKRFYDDSRGAATLSRLQYMDVKAYLAEDILTKVDRASMLCSLETRAPLLDHTLLEWIGTIPSEFHMKNSEKKYILKRSLEKHLPNEILYRKKMGFNMPTTWFKDEFTEYCSDLLLSDRFKNRRLFNPVFIEKLLSGSSKPGRDLSEKIWSLVFFEQWCINWLDDA